MQFVFLNNTFTLEIYTFLFILCAIFNLCKVPIQMKIISVNTYSYSIFSFLRQNIWKNIFLYNYIWSEFPEKNNFIYPCKYICHYNRIFTNHFPQKLYILKLLILLI